MAKRFKVVGGSFIMEDAVTGEIEIDERADSVYFDNNELNRGYIYIKQNDNTRSVDKKIGRKVALIDAVNENNVFFTEDSFREFAYNDFPGKPSRMIMSKEGNDIGFSAWGIPKTVLDYSLFHGMWTSDVPKRVWLQYNDTGAGFVEQTGIDNTLIKSLNSQLFVGNDGTTDTRLTSRRHPRYQPNRGLHYSTALALPNPTEARERRWGLKTNGSNGIVFSLLGDGTNWALRLIKTTTVDGVVSEIITNVTDKLPAGFDPAKGHTYDAQMQWRGFGDFFFFVDLKNTYTMAMLGTLTNVSIANPALSVTFECLGGVGVSSGIIVGCVDVTSEGGHKESKLPDSINTGTVLRGTVPAGTGMLAIKVPTEIVVNGHTVPYTRDIILSKLTTFCKDEAFRSVYIARSIDVPTLDALTWTDSVDSGYQYLVNSADYLNSAFQTDKASMVSIHATRGEKDFSIEHGFDPEGTSPRYLCAGEILVAELLSDANSTGGISLDLSEEV